MNTGFDAYRRNLGIDLLRIISMFLIVMLHVLGRSGILSAFEPNIETDITAVPLVSIKAITTYSLAWLIEIVAYCAVNCFALISGFVGINRRGEGKQISKYFSLWFQVAFYCIAITFIMFIVYPGSVGKGVILMALLPFSTEQYWYFTAYTGVFFCMPLLNFIVNLSVSEKRKISETGKIVIALFISIIVIYNTSSKLFGNDPLKLQDGYSFLWLAILYIAGAIVRKTECFKKVSTIKLLIAALLSLLIAWVWKLVFAIPLHHFKLAGINENLFISYLSPTVIVFSFVMLALFERITFNSGRLEKIISSVTPAVFGVYLLHVHPLIFTENIYGRLGSAAKLSAWKMLLLVLGSAIGIFIFGVLIEKARQWLFNRFGVDRIIVKATDCLQKMPFMLDREKS